MADSTGLLLRLLSPSAIALVVSFAATMALDLLGLSQPGWALAGTLVQSALCAAWLTVVLSLDVGDRSCDTPTLRERLRQRLWHLASAAVLGLVLVEKWHLVARASPIRLNDRPSYQLLSAVIGLVGIAGLFGRGHRLARFFALMAEHPARLMALSFSLASLFGGVLLALPTSANPGQHVGFLDAWFMATSAICVTGLAVHGVSNTYGFTGQAVLLGLVQIGGLGIMVLSAALVVLAGRRLQAKSSAALVEALDAESIASLRGIIRRIVGFTFMVELVGAALLLALFHERPEIALPHTAEHPLAGAHDVLWSAVFHSISAFCNAGFSLSRGGLAGFVDSWAVCSVVMALIVLGGLGFPVLSELFDRSRQRLRRQRPARLTLHARTVLLISTLLIVSVASLLLMLESHATLGNLDFSTRVLAALFQSVSLRTAGFNTVDIGAFGAPALFVCCLIMFIGASPGSTGGGIKTTTFAVFFAVFRAELTGGQPRFLDRRLSVHVVSRAVSVAFVSSIVLTLVTLALFITESQAPLSLVFEAVSAFATVGLSTGITPLLSGWGKLVIIVTMLIGRIGPLTFALAAASRPGRDAVRLPEERLMIG